MFEIKKRNPIARYASKFNQPKVIENKKTKVQRRKPRVWDIVLDG
jgi:hypothetical protein